MRSFICSRLVDFSFLGELNLRVPKMRYLIFKGREFGDSEIWVPPSPADPPTSLDASFLIGLLQDWEAGQGGDLNGDGPVLLIVADQMYLLTSRTTAAMASR